MPDTGLGQLLGGSGVIDPITGLPVGQSSGGGMGNLGNIDFSALQGLFGGGQGGGGLQDYSGLLGGSGLTDPLTGQPVGGGGGGQGGGFLNELLSGYDVNNQLRGLFSEYDPTQENYMKQQHSLGQQQQRQGFGQQLMGLGQQQRQQQAGSGFAGGGGGRGMEQARSQIGQQFGLQQQSAQSQLGQGLYGLQQSYEEQQRGTLADLISRGAVNQSIGPDVWANMQALAAQNTGP